MAAPTDRPVDRPVAVEGPYRATKRHSWGAIFAGAVVALGIQLLLGTLGIAIGLTVIDPAQEADPLSGVSVGGGIWWIISSAIAVLAGGWVAGRLAGFAGRFNGAIHGLATWALATLIGLYLMYSFIGAIMGGAWNAAAAAAQVADPNVTAAVPEDPNIPAMQYAQRVTNISAQAAWWSFFMLLISAVAGAAGGFVGAPQHARDEYHR